MKVEIDWSQPRPDAAAFAAGWERTMLSVVQPLDARLVAVATSLNETNAEGGGRVAQLAVDLDPAVAWFMLRNRFNEIDFFRRLFAHPLVTQALPEAGRATKEVNAFAPEDGFVAHGYLAAAIAGGGAYDRYTGTDADALALAANFIAAAHDGRFRRSNAWINTRAWSPWFRDIAWDQTFFWFDSEISVVTVLMITDSD